MVGLTRKLPKAELNTAAASLPPTALVRMTADDTGGGMHPTTWRLVGESGGEWGRVRESGEEWGMGYW